MSYSVLSLASFVPASLSSLAKMFEDKAVAYLSEASPG